MGSAVSHTGPRVRRHHAQSGYRASTPNILAGGTVDYRKQITLIDSVEFPFQFGYNLDSFNWLQPQPAPCILSMYTHSVLYHWPLGILRNCSDGRSQDFRNIIKIAINV